MSLFDIFRSFEPLSNPIGFGAADFLELFLGIVLLWQALVWLPWLEPLARRLAENKLWCAAVLGALPVILRLLLLPNHPAPTPNLHDEFSHLLVADTIRHFRLANPPHVFHQFFETMYVLQEPTYSSIYAIGQGMILALGRAFFGHPWAGVLLSVAAFCALCYWMLRGWTTPGWALTGGILAVIQFGPLNEWTNGYWGGAVSACAGCLIFGALPRLRERAATRDALLLGAGLGIQLLTRPYESILVGVGVILFLLLWLLRGKVEWRTLARVAPAIVLAVAPAVGLTVWQNRQITGSWTTLPYLLSRYEYGVPTTFTMQANPVPHRELTPQQQRAYEMQVSFHGNGTDTPRRFLERLEYRVRFYRFFFLAPLYLALAAAFWALRELRFRWVFATLLILALGANCYPFFFPHYMAAATCLFVLLSVTGLERLSRIEVRGYPAGETAARLLVLLCAAQFLFWYGMHVFDNARLSLAMRQYETWNGINHRLGDRRRGVAGQLAGLSGQQLVFVHYWPQHPFQEEWVYNAADIDASRVVWARDLGTGENEKLRRYYPDRKAWLLEADANPPRLTLYPPEPAAPSKPNVNPFLEIPQAKP